MGFKRNTIRFLSSGMRKIRRITRNRISQKILITSYRMYSVSRIIRNPFVILEHINIYNALRLLT